MSKAARTKRFLLWLVLLNLLDAIFTWISVSSGAAFEANPIMDAILKSGPIPFFSIKVLGSVLLYIAYKKIDNALANRVYYIILILFIFYVILVCMSTLSILIAMIGGS